jgi:hypothetical protein
MAPSLDVRSLDVPGLDSVDDPPTANKLPMVTNSLSSNSLNEKSLQLSVLQDATALTMEARAAALAQIEASIAPPISASRLVPVERTLATGEIEDEHIDRHARCGRVHV